MASVVVLRTKGLEAAVKNLENQRDDKDVFKRAILAKAGGISRGLDYMPSLYWTGYRQFFPHERRGEECRSGARPL